ncbi:hypothetical protein [Methylorubrum extorquens]|uniref:Uncharacterized protein n=1 Tax=Methylorubrum extorquens (strain ATCC 14718 / DSM 1338 / JCM 2805 / NCIMB 9133 / AM1) TaxID=272630 RepID=C5B3H4_METEA|nr:hypothetical protein [Methylorubrum extorquens]ACS43006.1 Hypothetical protein MexAM1_META2p0072 [Methylorubrum extorquens AM1]MCP1545952.1 hypothetical protein [Methylorubrum extorquens]MCP1591902.1 hypothetical protein [Methylorubrum extorquens]
MAEPGPIRPHRPKAGARRIRLSSRKARSWLPSLPPNHFVYHKAGDDVRFTGLRFTRDLRAPRDELPQLVTGADGETCGSLEEALPAWEAAGRPELVQPEGRYGPLIRLDEKRFIGPRP